MEIDLKGKTVMVTGATRGIGKAIAEELLLSGAIVALHGNKNPGSVKDLVDDHPNAELFLADLSKKDSTLELFDSVLGKFGKLDVLINNAGIAIESEWNKDDNEWLDDWETTLTVNLTASGILCKKAMEHFAERRGGIIINIASRAAFRGDTMSYLAYAASKGGMVALTRSIARGMGKNGITAFTIAPGFTRTEMAEQFIEKYGEEYAASDIALTEMTRPGDIAPFIVFLASGAAAHATGGTFDFNAGSYVH